MKLNEYLLTRRAMLKSMSATVAAAALAGCSTSDSDNDSYRVGSEFDYMEEDRIAFNTGSFNCGGRCVHKYHIKNDRIISMTSDGDLPPSMLNENDPDNRDEWDGNTTGKPMQYRSCVRGYSYVARVYQPDRLKYPLLQTGERGNLSTFKRISWDEAYKKIAEKYVDICERYNEFGYLPVVGGPGTTVAQRLGWTYLRGVSNASNGNNEGAKVDSVGGDAYRNGRGDDMNAGFIILWACDPSRNGNWDNGTYWTMIKAKENKIPIVSISPVCTDNAAIYSTPVQAQIPYDTLLGPARQVTIPGWVAIRPGTDGALSVAMMYVIYRRKLYDYQFLTQGNNRKCFGFWKNDSVKSVAEPSWALPGNPATISHGSQEGTPYAGQTFSLESGESFEEYLTSLERDISQGGWTPDGTGAAALPNVEPDPAVDSQCEVSREEYDHVLTYAAKLTGIKPEIIEALACHYANNGTAKASKIDCGIGAQRQYAGAEHVWLIICMTAVCGYSDKEGGGIGVGLGSSPDEHIFSQDPEGETYSSGVYNGPRSSAKYILYNSQNTAEVILTGRDGRTAEQFARDAELTTGESGITGVQIKFMSFSTSNALITRPNVNKSIKAFKDRSKVEMIVVTDNFMTPTAAHADIVLPAATHLERPVTDQWIWQGGDFLVHTQNVIRKPMYDCKYDDEISANMNYYIAEALAEKDAGKYGAAVEGRYSLYTPPKDLDSVEAVKGMLSTFRTSKYYDAITGQGVPIGGFSYEEFITTGKVSAVVPADKPFIGMQHFRLPGGTMPDGMPGASWTTALVNSTGYINFFSPFWKQRRSQIHPAQPIGKGNSWTAGWRTELAKYIPVREGYETFFDNDTPLGTFKGVPSLIPGRPNYKLQFVTNKARHRAHTNQANVAIIMDQFEQKVFMNPIDAGYRGIKDGDMVYIYNDRGCTRIPASVTDYIVPGSISIEHGAWYRASSDPKETVTICYQTMEDLINGRTPAMEKVPVDVGGSENILTDDLFTYDPVYISQAAGVHGGPCEVSLTKPE